jgi:hypothetical protein
LRPYATQNSEYCSNDCIVRHASFAFALMYGDGALAPPPAPAPAPAPAAGAKPAVKKPVKVQPVHFLLNYTMHSIFCGIVLLSFFI